MASHVCSTRSSDQITNRRLPDTTRHVLKTTSFLPGLGPLENFDKQKVMLNSKGINNHRCVLWLPWLPTKPIVSPVSSLVCGLGIMCCPFETSFLQTWKVLHLTSGFNSKQPIHNHRQGLANFALSRTSVYETTGITSRTQMVCDC